MSSRLGLAPSPSVTGPVTGPAAHRLAHSRCVERVLEAAKGARPHRSWGRGREGLPDPGAWRTSEPHSSLFPQIAGADSEWMREANVRSTPGGLQPLICLGTNVDSWPRSRCPSSQTIFPHRPSVFRCRMPCSGPGRPSASDPVDSFDTQASKIFRAHFS